MKVIGEVVFQLTPSRRATAADLEESDSCGISTHAHTEGDQNCFQFFKFHFISTHALTEGDRKTESVLCIDNISTHALTEGDPYAPAVILIFRISTHALTEGDDIGLLLGRVVPHFNSRPHGGRLQI